MHFRATAANLLWRAANVPAYRSYLRAVQTPGEVQHGKLQRYIRSNAATDFGKAHNFAKISNWEEFKRAVPLREYEEFVPWIDQIRRGEQRVLTQEPITHLIPTSGTTRARKLIPFTRGLQREFNAGIAPWLTDLNRRRPRLAFGPAYWSITPFFQESKSEDSLVPIGFQADTEYLGGATRRLVDATMAVPGWVQSAETMDAFRYVTLLLLLRCRELRLLSVWHPSFLSLLLDSAVDNWEQLLADICDGTCRYAAAFPKHIPGSSFGKPSPGRAGELAQLGPQEFQKFWPKLKVISCWGDGAAALALHRLEELFPDVLVQPKGLIATEAFVSLPFASEQPLAIHSHFFEFIDAQGIVHLADDLQRGEEYEVVVSTAGGLWRYRLNDRVLVTGFVQKTPSLSFLGRTGNVSDRFGEKLSESFVTQTLQDVFRSCGISPHFALLAPDENRRGWGYTLYMEGEVPEALHEQLEQALRNNHHYAYCQDLGQLLPLDVFVIEESGYAAFLEHQGKHSARLGDIKPASLSSRPGWSRIFRGSYVSGERAIGSVAH